MKYGVLLLLILGALVGCKTTENSLKSNPNSDNTKYYVKIGVGGEEFHPTIRGSTELFGNVFHNSNLSSVLVPKHIRGNFSSVDHRRLDFNLNYTLHRDAESGSFLINVKQGSSHRCDIDRGIFGSNGEILGLVCEGNKKKPFLISQYSFELNEIKRIPLNEDLVAEVLIEVSPYQ